MIISASRRTDIPAFYAEWFMNRIREGYLYVQNPFNANKHSKVNLSPFDIDVIVFWTKNPKPLLKYLDELDNLGYKYYFQFTVTGYPSLLEPSVPPLEKVLETFKNLSEKIGSNKVIWRFDPIIISDETSKDFILENFENIAKQLGNYTKRVVISFADFYKKVANNLNHLTKEKGIEFTDINQDLNQIKQISSFISGIALEHSLQIFSCAEKLDLSACGIESGKCIDDELVKNIFGSYLKLKKDKYQREECGCVGSKDIGQYNTCTHNCVYCYANYNKKIARRNMSLHDPGSPFLFENGNSKKTVIEDKEKQLSFTKLNK